MSQSTLKTAIKVFVSQTTPDAQSYRSFLLNVLQKAEMEVISPDYDNPDSEEQVWHLIKDSDCSVHILGNQYDAYSEFLFVKAQKYSKLVNEKFKLFVWKPAYFASVSDSQQDYWFSTIKNNVTHNVIIARHKSAVKLVEDINSITETILANYHRTTKTDIFFIYNELDQQTANTVSELISDVLGVEKLQISQNTAQNYSDYIIEQVKCSRLVVIFFKWANEWIPSFAQQVWKIIGGASSKTPILIIGDANNSANSDIIFTIPSINTLLIKEELIPLQVKIHFDRLPTL